ncbi:kinase-like protein [Hypoxylon sp. FL0543]|nr:kinase-like protein [Hypoxylon sp. FL0543]
MERRTRNMIFSLKGSNKRARKAIKHRHNRNSASHKWYRETCFNFGSFSFTKDSNQLLTLATLGSSKSRADIYISGTDIAPIHCALVVNYKTGIVLVEERSPRWTRVYQDAQTRTNRMGRGNPPRVAVLKGFNTILSLGKDEKDPARFEFLWNLTPEETLELIRRRISGASQEIQRRCLVNFIGQTPALENQPINHLPVAELGSGAFGRVWKTVDGLSGDFIAVKMLHRPNDPHDERWLHNVRYARDREVAILSRLRHPHVLQYLGSQGWDTGLVQIFFPLKSGSLHSLITSRSIPSDKRMEAGHTALVHILSAVDYLDYMGLVHRDIKPDNILYDLDHRGNLQFQLGDFGIANYQANAQTGAGTITYIAPEILDQRGRQTSRADVWSLFVTMLWVHNADQFRHNQARGMFKDPSEVQKAVIGATLSNGTVAYIREMGIFDPEYRATAGQMLVILGRRDLISTAVEPLRPRHFELWMQTVTTGYSPYSRYIRRLMDIPSG